MPVRHLVAHFRREVRAQAGGDEVGGEGEQVGEDAVFLQRFDEIAVAGRATGADGHAHHALDHEGVAVTPLGQQFVNVHDVRDEARGDLQDGFVAVDGDEQGGL